jgi:cytochrome c oxidase assembly protein subunit 15
MGLIRRLAFASTIATLVLVTIGGLVRATKSGLGCGTDWPHCSGKLIPELESRAVVIEYSHRVAASVVVILLAALAVLAWRRCRHEPRVRWGSVASFAVVLFQAALGAVVVKLELQSLSVVLHLAAAMTLLALLVFVTLAARDEGAERPGIDRSVARRSALAAGSVLALLLVGSYVSGTPGAGRAFGDWPVMNGSLVPDLASPPAALHFYHRVLAVVVGLVVGAVAVSIIRRKAEMPFQARLAHGALGLFVTEVLIGAANVWTGLNPLVVTAHLLVGALIWALLVAIAMGSRVQAPARSAEQTVARSRPVLDSVR